MSTLGTQFVGGLIAVVASVLSCVGANAQKKVHTRELRLHESARKHYIRRPFWWVGLGGVVFAALGDFAALGLASQPLVASLGGSATLLSNVVVARLWNKDLLVWSDVVGVLLVTAGAVFFGFKAEAQPHLEPREMRHQFVNEWMVVYLVMQLVVVFGLLAGVAHTSMHAFKLQSLELFLSPVFHRLEEQEGRIAELEGHLAYVHSKLRTLQRQVRAAALQAAELSGNFADLMHLQDGASTCRTLPASSKPAPVGNHWTDKYILAACAGAIGGLSVLFASCASNSLRHPVSALEDPFFYLYLVAMLVCVVSQTSLLNSSMKLGDMMSVFPVFESFWISFGVLGGLVFYNDKLPPGSWEQGYGLLFMLVGIGFFLLHPDPEATRGRSATTDTSLSDHLALFPHTPPRSWGVPGAGDMSPVSAGKGSAVSPRTSENHAWQREARDKLLAQRGVVPGVSKHGFSRMVAGGVDQMVLEGEEEELDPEPEEM